MTIIGGDGGSCGTACDEVEGPAAAAAADDPASRPACPARGAIKEAAPEVSSTENVTVVL